MSDYDKAIEIGKSYFNKYSTRYYYFLASTKNFKSFMLQNDLTFSKKSYKKWLFSIKQQQSYHVYVIYRRNLHILGEIIETGTFKSHSFKYDDNCPYLKLSYFSKNLFDKYIEFATPHYKKGCLKNIKNSILVFLLFCDKNNVTKCNQITHTFMKSFSGAIKCNKCYWNNIRKFLQYLRKINFTSLMLDLPFNSYYSNDLLYLENMSPADQQLFIKYIEPSNKNYNISMQQFDEACIKAIEFYKSQRYSQRAIASSFHDCVEFKLLMEINHFIFSKELIDSWADYFISKGITKYKDRRRRLYLIVDIIDGKPPSILPNIIPNKKHKYKVNSEFLNILDDYANERTRDGLNESTIRGYKCDCTVFFAYLYKVQIQYLIEITPQIIKDFQFQDIHLNPGAKNRCSSSIKGFLKYLERNQLIVPNIHLALSCEHAPQVKIVHILSENQLKFVEKYKKTDAIEDIAMILLGLRMGLRLCDVRNLKIANIDWEREVISFIQTKTNKSIIIPMPIEVGNALFDYLNNIRPASSEPYVFITNQVPFSRVSPFICENALRKAIEGSKEKASFHDLRRTYSSKLLNANNPISYISESLGHSNESTLDKYLSLDKERMKLCTTNLNSIEYKGNWL